MAIEKLWLWSCLLELENIDHGRQRVNQILAEGGLGDGPGPGQGHVQGAARTHGAAFSEGRGSRGWRQRFSLFVAEYAQKGTHYFILSMSSSTCCGLGTMLDEGHAVMDKNVEAPVPTEVRTEEKRIGSCLDLRLGVQEAFT